MGQSHLGPIGEERVRMLEENNDEQVVLALDTSTDMLACALAKLSKGRLEILSTGDHLCRRRANVELVSTCQDVLIKSGLTVDDIDAVLVGRGPGSFTGVRIGIATGKGLACGLSSPLFGASTLDAYAWVAWTRGVRGLIGVAADAMRGEIYPGIYQLDETGAHREFESETVAKADAVVEHWSSRTDAEELILTGNGLKKYRDRFEAAGFLRFTDEELWLPSGEGLLRAAFSPQGRLMVGDGDPALVLPVYTRLSDAEENERKRLGLTAPASVKVTGVDDILASVHLQFRPMSVNDLSAVPALEAAVYQDSPHTAWTQSQLYEDMMQPSHSWWIAHDQGEVVGFAGGMRAGSDFEIVDVVVKDAYRRKGIGARLLSRISYDAQMLGAHTTSLEVDQANNAARALYESLGFHQIAQRSNYYGAGHDAIIMKTNLPLSFSDQLLQERPEPSPSIRPWPIKLKVRDKACQTKIDAARPLILSIESSCDETAMAVIDAKGEICANVVATQIDFHARFGGVVPEIASRKHTEAIVGVFEKTLEDAGKHFGCDSLEPSDLSAVGVTAGPGLVGALVVGVAFAKGLCVGVGLPLIAVNHLEGHLFANLFETPDLKPPFVTSLVSGGNTMLAYVRGWGDYEVLGATIDDAVGEAFDKVAKALGLGYPGGPIISRLAAKGNPKAIHFPRAMMHSHDFRFSLSGLKTAVITYIQGENKAGRAVDLPDLAASFEAAVIDVQVAKAAAAVEQTGVSEFCVGGGVAANPQLREAYRQKFAKIGVRVTVPPMAVCGDNGAMIAAVALRSYKAGLYAPLTLDAEPNAKLGKWSCDEPPVVCSDWLIQEK